MHSVPAEAGIRVFMGVIVSALGVALLPCVSSVPIFHVVKLHGSGAGGSVLDLGRRGAFDSLWVTCPSVVFDGKTYRMWYSSFYDSHQGRGGIGLATSTDGIHWKRANGGRPVLTAGKPGAFDDGQVMGPEVLYSGGVYRMWYTGMSTVWDKSGFGFYRIGLATSHDGIHWRRENNGKPVLDIGPPGSPDAVQAATPSILRENGEYRMWYAAWAPKPSHTICMAVSNGGIHWHREFDGSPVIGLAPGGDYAPAIARIGGQYLMLYMRLAKVVPGLYAATSKDGRHWTPVGDGPFLRPGQDNQFDSALVGHADILKVGNQWKVWYTGYRREPGGSYGWKLRIGVAKIREGME